MRPVQLQLFWVLRSFVYVTSLLLFSSCFVGNTERLWFTVFFRSLCFCLKFFCLSLGLRRLSSQAAFCGYCFPLSCLLLFSAAADISMFSQRLRDAWRESCFVSDAKALLRVPVTTRNTFLVLTQVFGYLLWRQTWWSDFLAQRSQVRVADNTTFCKNTLDSHLVRSWQTTVLISPRNGEKV